MLVEPAQTAVEEVAIEIVGVMMVETFMVIPVLATTAGTAHVSLLVSSHRTTSPFCKTDDV